MEDSLNIKRINIIDASLPFVIEYGWSEEALSKASISLKEDPQYWGLFFSNILEAVTFFEKLEDQKMLDNLVQYGELDGIRNKIGKALFERIYNISGRILMLKKLEEFYFGKNAPTAVQNIWNTADIIWNFAGDKATDFNHYTKRTLLSGVYVAVVKKVLSLSYNDNKEIELELQEYIQDVLNKVVKLGGVKKYFKLPKIEDIPILRMFL